MQHIIILSNCALQICYTKFKGRKTHFSVHIVGMDGLQTVAFTVKTKYVLHLIMKRYDSI